MVSWDTLRRRGERILVEENNWQMRNVGRRGILGRRDADTGGLFVAGK